MTEKNETKTKTKNIAGGGQYLYRDGGPRRKKLLCDQSAVFRQIRPKGSFD